MDSDPTYSSNTDSTLSVRRSEVIEKFIQIETLLNLIIATHYWGGTGGAIDTFIREVLYDEYFSFQLKRNILDKLLSRSTGYLDNDKLNDEGKMEMLRRLSKIRNTFAHCGPFFVVEKKGTVTLVTPHPSKDASAELDLDSQYHEFNDKYLCVKDWLESIKVAIERYIEQTFGTGQRQQSD